MPDLSTLVDSVYRDLADEAKVVFSTLQVEDFIRGGIAELNRVAPIDTTDDIQFVTDPATGQITQFVYPTSLSLVYSVEQYRLSDGVVMPIPSAEAGETVMSGYLFRETPVGGVIEFPQFYLTSLDPNRYLIRARGYGKRPIPYETVGQPSPEVAVSGEDEYALRDYAKAQGFDLLAHDRSLFAQWQGQTNNTDVSPTQMLQMAANAQQAWSRRRGLIRVVRRYW